jgi:hypothetical protein
MAQRLRVSHGMMAVFWTVALAASTPFVHAQFDTATVLGAIRDGSGAVVSGARETLDNVSRGISSKYVADANGIYESPSGMFTFALPD